ncbi:MAG: tRNA pseudouridine(38-40) synthase TruA [Deltaproteobacteria bacterium]|nr:tRNA pseudouridine(38-40) synthase TruA [Deltaproteobacteria bacterium]
MSLVQVYSLSSKVSDSLTSIKRRFVFKVQYLGKNFAGWQVQPGKRTVQGLLEETFSSIVQEPIRVIGAGRTDSGVHALGQVAHFESSTSLSVEILLKAANSRLPYEVGIFDLKEVDQSFHANRSALYKVYSYWVLVSEKAWPFLSPWTWKVYGVYNLKAMQACLSFIEGRHNFKSFAAADGSSKTFERHLIQAGVEEKSLADFFKHTCDYFKIPAPLLSFKEEEAKLLCFYFKGEGFLKHMVRNLVGTLVEVGWGKRSVEDFKALLAVQDRQQAGRTAPARGLSLIEVGY